MEWKTGDRVRVVKDGLSTTGAVGMLGTVHTVQDGDSFPVQVEMDAGGSYTSKAVSGAYRWSWFNRDALEPVAAAPAAATLTVEAGKFYKTRDGRKVGPVRFSDRGIEFATADGFNHDRWYTQNNPNFAGAYINASIRGERADDLVAEWVDEPGATEQVPLKVGDAVTVIANKAGKVSFIGQTGKVRQIEGARLSVSFGEDPARWFSWSEVAPAAVATATAAPEVDIEVAIEPTPTIGAAVMVPGWITAINHSAKGTVYGVAFETKNRRVSLHFLEEDFITVDEGDCPCAENDNGALPLTPNTAAAFDDLCGSIFGLTMRTA